MNQVLATTHNVLDQAQLVRINQRNVQEFARSFQHSKTHHWMDVAPFDFSALTVEEQLHFIFLYNAVSFSFWGEPKWTIEHEGKQWDGAWGMIIALGRAIKAGVPLLDFAQIPSITQEDFAQVLRGNVEIPLFEQRHAILQDVAKVMTQFYDGKVSQLVKQAEGDALKLLDLIVDRFPSFHDTSVYNGTEICFYKRAQLLTADISQFFSGTEFGDLKQMGELTACADYKLPQILRKQGIIEYVDELAQRIDQKIEIPHGSQEEMEIRAHTIWAVELMTREIKKQAPKIIPIEVSDHLWLATQQKFPDDKPYHRTRTTAY